MNQPVKLRFGCRASQSFVLPVSVRVFVIAVAALFLNGLTVQAANYYVSTTGNDTNSGTETLPWRTIQKAANTLSPGDTAYVRGGVYFEAITVSVSGSAAGGYVTFQNYPGEVPIVDGSTTPVPDGNGALFGIVGRSYVSISGFEIRNYRTNHNAIVPAGIWVAGAAHDITICSNNIHHIENTNANGNAFGLAVYGDTFSTISNLIIRANELHDLKTGWSESLVLNGNVSDFEVSSNRVHDNWNIGILFAGYEGTCPDANLDRARHGVCRDNTVWRCSTASNPNYGEPSCAGIYCDGSTDIIVERNKSFLNDIGLEFASENKGKQTDHITVRDNLCWSNGMGGIFIGGYDAQRGRTEFCSITHNTLYHNDTLGWGQGEFLLQFDTRTNTFTHNILVVADTANNLLIANTFTQNTNNTVDWNLFYAPGGAAASQWQWKNTARTGFEAYRAASGNDAHSIFADPQIVGSTVPDLHLQTNSPAIDAGDPSFVPGSGETDMDGQARVLGWYVDLGADEASSRAPAIEITNLPPFGSFQDLGGCVSNVNPADYRVAVFIFVPGAGWYTKPTCDQPLTLIQTNSSWTADITTGGSDQNATKIAALLVSTNYSQPCVLDAPSLPTNVTAQAVASVIVERDDPSVRRLDFSGYNWWVKSSTDKVGPGPNYFSDSTNNVWLDALGQLHLRITHRSNAWQCAEIVTRRTFGYGQYRFQIGTDVDNLDRYGVLGLFTWSDDAAYDHREIDIEYSRWGDAADTNNAQYVVQPYDVTGHLVRLRVPLGITNANHHFTWETNQVSFQSLQGDFSLSPDPTNVIGQWVYALDVPPTGDENVRINLWLDQGHAPFDGNEMEVIIKSFEFVPQSALPAITRQPIDVMVAAGGTATFSVTATGTPPLSYQWQFNGTNLAGATDAILALTNVQPANVGTYRVVASNAYGTVISSPGTLKIGWRFFVYGDSRGNSSDNQINTTILAEMASVTTNEKPAFVLVPGDLVYSGNLAAFRSWSNIMSPVYQSGIGVYPVMGNHDTDDVDAFKTVFGPTLPDNGPSGEINRTYAVVHDNVLVLALDEYVTSGRVNQDWVNTVLATNTQPHIFAFGHEPAFKAHHTDCLDDYPADRDVFWSSLSYVGGHAFFACHDHFYDHARLDDGDGNEANDVHQFIVGTAGAPLASSYSYDGVNSGWTPTNVFHEMQYGYLAVEIEGNNVTTTWYHRTAPGVYGAAESGLLFSGNNPPATNPPAIMRQPTGITVTAGKTTNFTVAAIGTPPLSYQWRFNGSDITGATAVTYTLSPALTNHAGNYDVLVTNAYGAVTSSLAVLTVVPDTNRPVVAFTSPVANLRVTNAWLTVRGTASDNIGVTQVWYQLGDGAFQLATGTTSWSVTLTLSPGSNTVRVKSLDWSGNESDTKTRSFFFAVPTTLTLVTNGSGKVSSTRSSFGTPTNWATLEIGRAYKVTALPGSNNLFTNWTASVNGGSTNVASGAARYSFLMQSNLTLIANFVTNRFLTTAGNYYGLFWDTNRGVAHGSAGYFKLTVKSPSSALPSFTGKLSVEGQAHSFGGSFDLAGSSSIPAPVTRKGKSSLAVRLQLDCAGGDALSGSVSNLDGSWVAQLAGDRAVFNKTNPAGTYAGSYTLVLPAPPDRIPGGDSYAIAVVASNGSITVIGALGDAQALKPSATVVSKHGDWAFYAPAYLWTNGNNALVLKQYAGEILGWLNISNDAARHIVGNLTWTKTGWTNGYYDAGFTNEVTVLGGRYTGNTNRLVDITNGVIVLSGGNLASDYTNSFVLNAGNKFVVTNTPYGQLAENGLKVTPTPKTGLVRVTFRNPGNTNVLTTATGVVLPEEEVVRGMFKGLTNESGSVLLQGD